MSLEDKYIYAITCFKEYEQKKLLNKGYVDASIKFPRIMKKICKNESIVHKLRYYDLNYWSSNYLLTMEDRLSMAHSLEARPCFYDHTLVNLSFNLSTYDLIRNSFFPVNKYIFQKIMRKRLPSLIIKRKKMGFDVPLKVWFDGSLGEIANYIFDKKDHISNFFNETYVNDLIDDIQKNKAYRRPKVQKLFAIIVFEIYYKLFIENVRAKNVYDMF